MAAAPKFRFVCATRHSQQDFLNHSALGRSLRLIRSPLMELRLTERNTQGLPVVYNQAIADAAKNPAILVFVHDDVWLCDYFWADRMLDALRVFDLVGLAGNIRRVPRQANWAYLDEKFTKDDNRNLSGIIGEGQGFPPEHLHVFGRPAQPVKLLDGVLLFCHSALLINKNLRFDERFDFHFYDMDISRQAELKGVKMGTWGLSVVHQSAGNFSNESWRAAYAKYLEKWRE